MSKGLAALYGVALATDAYTGIKHKFVPFPIPIVRTSLGFAMLSLVEMMSPELSIALAFGYLIVNWIKLYNYEKSIPSLLAGDNSGLLAMWELYANSWNTPRKGGYAKKLDDSLGAYISAFPFIGFGASTQSAGSTSGTSAPTPSAPTVTTTTPKGPVST